MHTSIHCNNKIVVESVRGEAHYVYEGILHTPILDKYNHVRFIGVKPVNGKDIS